MDVRHSCTHCNKNLSSSSALSHHLETHQVKKSYVCDTCGKDFGQKSKLKEHQFRHKGIFPYVCTICEKGFYQNDRLKTHIMGHNGERPYNCHECSMSFRRKYELNKHKKTHDVLEKNKLLRHECLICGKKNYSPSDLKKHMFKHTEERPEQCPFCEKTFKERYTLKCHILMQHEPVPHEQLDILG